MNILGLSGGTHDSAAALLVDGKVAAAIEEERLSRMKKAPHTLPIRAARACLEQTGTRPQDIDAVAYFIDPDTYDKQVYGHILYDWRRYLIHPLAYRTSSFLKRGKRYRSEAKEIVDKLGILAPIEFVRHHLSHAASAFYLSPFDDAMILTLDNMGELDSTFMAYGSGTDITPLRGQRIPHSLGMLYATLTDYLGFRPWFDEGKVMALAAYGKPKIPLGEMVEFGNGQFEIRRPFQMIETVEHNRVYSDSLMKLLGPPRQPHEHITQRHKDIAASLQYAVEEVAKHLVIWMHEQTGLRSLCMAGGVALNCKMNGELSSLPFIDDMYVTPASGDAGTAIGAAAYVHVFRSGRRPEALLRTGIGRTFTDCQIEEAISESGFAYTKNDDPSEEAAKRLMEEGVIAWYQGGSEIGPRALGHRSILALPNKIGLRDYINRHVKGRELWRPLCPSLLGRNVEKYFPGGADSLFMNISHRGGSLEETLPEIFHVDGTARIQAVYERESAVYHQLLERMGTVNGYPILINTSYNCHGEPIVDSPQDAIECYARTPLRTLVIGNYVVRKGVHENRHRMQ